MFRKDAILSDIHLTSEQNAELRNKLTIILWLAQAIQARPEAAGTVIPHKASTIQRSVDEIGELLGWPARRRELQSSIAATASSRTVESSSLTETQKENS